MIKTKNGIVTLQVPEGDVKALLAAISYHASDHEVSPSDTLKRKAIELKHLHKQLLDQAFAQGWKDS